MLRLWRKTTKGKVVYKRKKHRFGVSDAANIVMSLDGISEKDPEFDKLVGYGAGGAWHVIISIALRKLRRIFFRQGVQMDVFMVYQDIKIKQDVKAAQELVDFMAKIMAVISAANTVTKYLPFLGSVTQIADDVYKLYTDSMTQGMPRVEYDAVLKRYVVK